MTTPVSKVAVVGAGVVGLSVAHVLKLRHGTSVEIHVIASIIGDGTTSSGAGGLWEPYRLDGTDPSFVHSLSRASLEHFLLLHDDETLRTESGVRKRSAYQLLQGTTFEDPFWHDLVKNYQRLDEGDLQKIAIDKNLNVPARFQCGYSFDTVVADPNYYLNYLEENLKRQGGVTFTQRTLVGLSELDEDEDDYDVIVNCTGLGAARLVDDGDVRPIRGQVVRVVESPSSSKKEVDCCIFFDNDYVIPNVDNIVVGGTTQVDDWNDKSDKQDVEDILGRVKSVILDLQDAKVVREWAGLRPWRTIGLRTEIENRGSGLCPIVHNYGHGGSGFTIAMGTAEHVADNFLDEILMKKKE